MAAVSVTSVRVLDNPAPFTNPLQFEIQYECLYPLKHGAYGFLVFGCLN
jgi:histone chaperone ASF1